MLPRRNYGQTPVNKVIYEPSSLPQILMIVKKGFITLLIISYFLN